MLWANGPDADVWAALGLYRTLVGHIGLLMRRKAPKAVIRALEE